MVEILAILLTFGSVLYHFSSGDFFAVSLVGFVVASSLFFWIKSFKGFIFCLLIFSSFILGALNIYKSEKNWSKEIFGQRQFQADVLSIDKRVANNFLVVKDHDYGENIRISISQGGDILPGDELSIFGLVTQPEDFVTSNGRIFDYDEYLKNKNIVAVMQNPEVKIIRIGGFSISKIATIMRYKIHNISSEYITFPFDGVLSAMVFGYQGGIPSFVTNLFRDTGVLHMLVLSGYNITLMALFLVIILKPLPFRLKSIITMLLIFALVMISGTGVASVRAGIMGGIATFAGITRRSYNALRALTLSYLLFFFITPNSIFSDPGLHLSFLATFFMIFVLPKVEKLFAFLPNYKYLNLREIISLAFLVPIFTLPYIMYFSGIFPLVSPIANAVLSIFVPVIMILGILLFAISWVGPLASIIGIIISFLGNFVLIFLEKISSVPIWNTPPIPWWCVSIIYILFVGVFLERRLFCT